MLEKSQKKNFTKANLWKLNLTKWILSVSLAIFLFTVLASMFSLLGSWLIILLGYRNWFLNQNSLYLFLFLALAVFLIMSFSLFVSEKAILGKIEKLQNFGNLNALVLISTILSILLLTGCYLGFSFYLSWLYQSFWL